MDGATTPTRFLTKSGHDFAIQDGLCVPENSNASTGHALDVIVVTPIAGEAAVDGDGDGENASSLVADAGGGSESAAAPATASSDFVVRFPSVPSVAATTAAAAEVSAAWTRAPKPARLKARLRGISAGKISDRATSIGSIDSSASTGSGLGAAAEPSAAPTLPSDEIPPNQPYVEVIVNGCVVPGMTMLYDPQKNVDGGTGCAFLRGRSAKPPADALKRMVQSGGLQSGKNDLLYRLVVVQRTEMPQSDTPTESGQEGGTQPPPPPAARMSVLATATAFLFLWSAADSVVVSDVDGTVTKSDFRGVIDTVVTERYAHAHSGVCRLYSEMAEIDLDDSDSAVTGEGQNAVETVRCSMATKEGLQNIDVFVDGSAQSPEKYASETAAAPTPPPKGRVRFLYLSSRPLNLVNLTRKFLVSLSQSHEHCCEEHAGKNHTREYCLPPGPILCHTGSLSTVLYTELISRDTHKFKSDVLTRQVILPFAAAGRISENAPPRVTLEEIGSGQHIIRPVFLAGFGNKSTDANAYKLAGIDPSCIFVIGKDSKLERMDHLRDGSSIFGRGSGSGKKGKNVRRSNSMLSLRGPGPRDETIGRSESSGGDVGLEMSVRSAPPTPGRRHSSSEAEEMAVSKTLAVDILDAATDAGCCETETSLDGKAGAWTTEKSLNSLPESEDAPDRTASAPSKSKDWRRAISKAAKKTRVVRAISGDEKKPSKDKKMFRGYDDPNLARWVSYTMLRVDVDSDDDDDESEEIDSNGR